MNAASFYPALYAAQSIGGHLLTITSAAENEFVRETFGNFGGVPRRLWLNATDRDEEGNFVWLNYAPFEYSNFAVGEPNNFGGNEDYLEIHPDGTWNDLSTLDASAADHYVVVEVGCACDWNASGSVNSQDFFDFLADFFNGQANFDCTGGTNSQDFFEFLTCFFGGCA